MFIRWLKRLFSASLETLSRTITRFRAQSTDPIQGDEARLQNFMDMLPVCISYVDAARRYQFANSTYEAWFGYDRSEIYGKHLREILGENAYRVAQHYVEQVLAGQPVSYEAEIPYQRGGSRYVRAVLVPDIDSSAQVKGYYALVTDVSAQKQAELALRYSEERFAKTFRASPIAILISSFPEDRIIDVNDAWCQLMGYRRDEVLGRTSNELEFWHRRSDRLNLMQQLSQHGSVIDLELRFQTQSGEIRDGRLNVEVVELNGDRCILAMLLDITRQKYAESALRESEERFRSIFEHVSVGISLIDPDGYVLAINEAGGRFLGYAESELIGMHFAQLTHPEDLRLDVSLYAALVMGQRSSYTIDKRYIRKDGTIVWGALTVSLIRNDMAGVRYAIAVCEDISDRKRAEQALWQQAERERVLRSISQRIRQSLDLDQILTTAVTEVRQTLQADRAIIFRLNSNGSSEVIKESALPAYPAMLGACWLERCFPDECYEYYQKGQPRIVPNVFTDPWTDGLAEFMQHMGIKSKLVAPIIQPVENTSSEVWGLLIVHACSSYRQWQPDEAELLQQLSNQLAIAIHHADHHHKLQQELAERQKTELALQQALAREQQAIQRERFIAAIAQHIRQSLDLNQVLHTTVQEVRQFLQVDRVIMFRLQAKGEATVAAEAVEKRYPSMLGTAISANWVQQIITAYHQQGASAVNNVQNDDSLSASVQQHLLQNQIKAFLTIPILQEDRILGILSAHQCDRLREWQPYEITLLEQLATQVAIAIQQSELYEQMQQLNTYLEEEVQHRTAQLQQASDFEATLKRIADRVRDSLDEAQILQTAVRELALAIGVNACNAALYDPEQRISTILYEYTADGHPRFQGQIVPMASFPEGYRQLLQGQYFQFCSNSSRSVDEETAILACPIFDDQGSLGDLWLLHHPSCEFSEQDVRLVQQVANQCAIAIRQSRLFQATQAQVEELERLNLLKDDFLSTVSHELRTPMASIKMAIQMLEMILFEENPEETGANPAQHPEEQQNFQAAADSVSLRLSPASFQRLSRYFQVLKDECHREINLIDDLLDLTRLDAGTEPLFLTTIYPAIWVLHMLESFTERIHSQQQQLQVDVPEDLPPLTTDLGCLERIIVELLNNACKYTPAHETIAISARAVTDAIQLRIQNTGVEIPAEERDRIFDKFYRIPSSDPWKHGGTGLGLALVKKLVERLQGSIWAESSNQSTTFIVQLPTQPASETT
jgi:PAS domain S-box-containing protein